MTTTTPNLGLTKPDILGPHPWAPQMNANLDLLDAAIAALGGGGGGPGDALTTQPLSQFAATTSLQLKNVITDETGSGALVFGTSPTIVTPTIASFVNATHDHQAAAGGGTLAEAALALTDILTNDVSITKHGFVPKLPNDATKFLNGVGAWTAPAGGGGGGDALTSGTLAQFAATTSLQLKNLISDETGSGALVFGTSPTIVTPTITAPATLTGSGDQILFETAEAGYGDFAITRETFAGQGNSAGTRADQAIKFGYNIGASVVAGDDAFGFIFENSYWTGVGGVRQGEFYFYAASGDGVLSRRPFGISAQYDLHRINANFAVTQLDLGATEVDPVFRFQFNPAVVTAGSMLITQAGIIDWQGTGNGTGDFIVKGGENILGIGNSFTTGRLFSGRTKIMIGGDQDPGSVTVKLFFGAEGNNRGIQWSHTNTRLELLSGTPLLTNNAVGVSGADAEILTLQPSVGQTAATLFIKNSSGAAKATIMPDGKGHFTSLGIGTDAQYGNVGTISGTFASSRTFTLTDIGGTFVVASAVNSVSPTSPNRTLTINIGGTTYYVAAKTTND